VVTSFRGVGLVVRMAVKGSRDEGFADLGDDDSMAAAYALESVLKAVGDVMSRSDCRAVLDLLSVVDVGWLIARDNLGLLGVDIAGAGTGWLITASIVQC